jgi:transposase
VECWLLNAQHLRNVPGRKTDVQDAEWICSLVAHGLVRPSFVPSKPVPELRDLTRYRRAKIQERTSEVQRLDKVLQDAAIKLSSVTSRVLGACGRAMLDALVQGTHDPALLAELAKGRLRAKLPELLEALAGRLIGHHTLLVGQMLAQIDFLDETIAAMSERTEELIAPFSTEVELLRTIPVVDRRSAEVIVAEIGPDMSRFPSAGHLASRAGLCPGNNEAAGKRKSGRTRKGSKWLRATLTESATAAARTRGTNLSAHYHRLRGRRGPGKATSRSPTRSSYAPTTCSSTASRTQASATTTTSAGKPSAPTATASGSSASSNALDTRSSSSRYQPPPNPDHTPKRGCQPTPERGCQPTPAAF